MRCVQHKGRGRERKQTDIRGKRERERSRLTDQQTNKSVYPLKGKKEVREVRERQKLPTVFLENQKQKPKSAQASERKTQKKKENKKNLNRLSEL